MYIDSPTATTPQTTRTETEELAVLCKALGHPARIAILRHLLAEDHCICGRIVEVMPLAQSTVSQHLKILKQSGLVLGEVEGPKTCYCIDKSRLAYLFEVMSTVFKNEGKK